MAIPRGEFRARAAREARAMGYGPSSYWEYLEQSALEHYAYYIARGDKAKASEMLERSLADTIKGNNGD